MTQTIKQEDPASQGPPGEDKLDRRPEYDYSTMYKSPQGIEVHREWYNRRLKRLAIPMESRTIETRFGHSHALVGGPAGAPPLVFLHSLLDDALEWEAQLPYFAQTYRVYALDMIGNSARSAPVHLATSNSDWAIWLLEMLHGLELPKADLVGLMSGCGPIVKLAGFTPGRINSAILINPQHIVASHLFRSPLRFFTALGAELFQIPWLIRKLIGYNCAPRARLPEKTIQEGIEHYRMIMKYLKSPPRIGLFTDPELSKLAGIPTLLVLGQQQRYLNTAEVIKRLRRGTPNLAVEMVPEAGSSPVEERSDYVNMVLTNFLRYVHSLPHPPIP